MATPGLQLLVGSKERPPKARYPETVSYYVPKLPMVNKHTVTDNDMHMRVQQCTHAHTRTYLHRYVDTCVRTYMHTHIHTCMHRYMRT